MAVNDVNLKINLDDYGSVSTIGELKKQLKELKSAALEAGEGSEAFDKISQKAGELNDKIVRVNESISRNTGNAVENATKGLTNLAGVGVGAFQAVQGAMAMFGVESQDLQKTLVALNGAMALSQGLKSLSEAPDIIRDSVAAFKALNIVTKANEGLTFLATAAQTAFAAATGGVTLSMTALKLAIAATGIGLLIVAVGSAITYFNRLSDSAETSSKRIKDNAIAIEDLNNVVKNTTETQSDALRIAKQNLELAQIQGKDAKTLMDLKKAVAKATYDLADAEQTADESIIESNQKKIDAIIKSGEERYDGERKDLEDNVKFFRTQLQRNIDIKKGYTFEITKIDAEYDRIVREQNERRKKEEDDRVKTYKENIKSIKDDLYDLANSTISLEESQRKVGKAIVDNEVKGITGIENLTMAYELQSDRELKIEQEKADLKYKIAENTVNALTGLNDIYYAIAASSGTKDLKRQEKQAKIAFENQKKINIAATIASGIFGVQNALTAKSLLPEPAAQILRISTAAAIGISTAANVAKIASTKFDSTSFSPDMGGSGDNGGGSQQPSTFTAPQFFGLGNGTNPNGGNQPSPLQVYVLENDITNAQQNVLGYIQTSVLTLGQPENTNGPFGPI